jgi:hypothetical protein
MVTGKQVIEEQKAPEFHSICIPGIGRRIVLRVGDVIVAVGLESILDPKVVPHIDVDRVI